MRSDCPHCGKPIAKRLVLSRPAPGQRKFLPMLAIAVCPLCKGDIATNVHPLERRIGPIMGAPLFLALALFMPYPGPLTAGLLGVAVLICAVAAVYLQIKTKDWQRYRRYAP